MKFDLLERPGPNLHDEIIAGGIVVTGYKTVNRKIVDGKATRVPMYFEVLGPEESDRSAIQAIIDAHVPFGGWADKRREELRRERAARILDAHPTVNWLDEITVMLIALTEGTTVNPSDLSALKTTFAKSKQVARKSRDIKILLNAMSDDDAQGFDVTDDTHWQ